MCCRVAILLFSASSWLRLGALHSPRSLARWRRRTGCAPQSCLELLSPVIVAVIRVRYRERGKSTADKYTEVSTFKNYIILVYLPVGTIQGERLYFESNRIRLVSPFVWRL